MFGTIGVVTADQARYNKFTHSYINLTPPGPIKPIWKSGTNIAQARNQILREAVGDWVWFLDDDMTFEPDCLKRLLSWDVPIVAPLCLMRFPPFPPVTKARWIPERGTWEKRMIETGDKGLVAVEATGTAGLLLRREVWETLSDPWFEVGRVRPDELGEDLWFCKKAREAGFPIAVDFDTHMGHLTPVEVWPVRQPDETWKVGLKCGKAIYYLPMPQVMRD
jgi:glycosyltransferase involved in cell wall biosynthesis